MSPVQACFISSWEEGGVSPVKMLKSAVETKVGAPLV